MSLLIVIVTGGSGTFGPVEPEPVQALTFDGAPLVFDGTPLTFTE